MAEEGGRVRGRGRLTPWSPRPTCAPTAETSVHIAEGACEMGVGRARPAALVERARAGCIALRIARIPGENPASVAPHEGAGFRTFGVQKRAGEKFGRVLDGRRMDLHLDGGGPGPSGG